MEAEAPNIVYSLLLHIYPQTVIHGTVTKTKSSSREFKSFSLLLIKSSVGLNKRLQEKVRKCIICLVVILQVLISLSGITGISNLVQSIQKS